ncbi:MAG: ABC transporter permease subunit/CPBP intramembrane protease [Planctomycetota bacterium]
MSAHIESPTEGPPEAPRRLSQPRSRLVRLCQKELRETLRDRRTIITLLLMPLLVYPLLSMALNRFLVSAATGLSEQAPYTIGVATRAEKNSLDSWLADSMSQPPEAILQASGGNLAKLQVYVCEFEDVGKLEPVEALKQNRIDVACVVDAGTPPTLDITSYNGDTASESATRILVERLHWLRLNRAEWIANQLTKYTPPASFNVTAVGEPEKPSMLGTIVPLVLVLMTITGAVYPAIDLTAGERERGTMESLMASPVPRSYILFSKYVAVVVVALLTAVANLLAMFTTLWAGRLLPLLTGGDEGFPWLAVLQILGLLVLFSGFFAAVLLSLTSFARSFKEAQAYLIPVMLLSLAPGMLSLMPGVSLSGPLAIAPLINIVILAREVLQGTASPGAAIVTILSTLGYAAAAIAIASKLFGNDAVTRTSAQSFSSILRRPDQVNAIPSPQTAAMMLALLVPIYYLVSSVLSRYSPDLSSFASLTLNAVALILTFGGVPLASVLLTRCRIRTTYRMHPPGILGMIGAALVGVGAWGIAHESFVIGESLGLGGMSMEKLAQAQGAAEKMKAAPAWLLLFSLAFTPAVIEEFCFRGVLFSALGKVLKPHRLIIVTAVIFGLFHVTTGSVLLLERFIPTTLVGLILGWIAYRTQSIWPGILMHMTHNGLLILAIKYEDALEARIGATESVGHLPVTWILGLSTMTLIGIGIVWVGTRHGSSDGATNANALDG